jgi:hypothetical protein
MEQSLGHSHMFGGRGMGGRSACSPGAVIVIEQ